MDNYVNPHARIYVEQKYAKKKQQFIHCSSYIIT